MSDVGHNASADLIKSTVSRFENIEEQVVALRADQKEVMGNAKALGLDVKVLRQLIRVRKQDPDAVAETEQLLEVYRRALEG
jgi:uncharacterized protein (UPF0335 family)